MKGAVRGKWSDLGGFCLAEDAAACLGGFPSVETPRSSVSAGLEGGGSSSAFGSGSSVLSQWEPPGGFPCEADLLAGMAGDRSGSLAQLLEGSAACDGNLVSGLGREGKERKTKGIDVEVRLWVHRAREDKVGGERMGGKRRQLCIGFVVLWCSWWLEAADIKEVSGWI